MRKIVFGAVVVTLAGTCWVVAQNGSNDRPVSPYGMQSPAPVKQNAANPAMLPVPSDTMPVVVPLTDLSSTGVAIPELPAAAKTALPDLQMSMPVKIPESPATVKPTVMLPIAIPEPAPLLELPPEPAPSPTISVPARMIPVVEPLIVPIQKSIAVTAPLPPPVEPIPVSGIPAAPINRAEMPAIPAPPPTRQPNRAAIKSASPIIPALPPVPGVQGDYTGVSPDIVVQDTTRPPAFSGPIVNPAEPQRAPLTAYSVDAPSTAVEGQPIFNDSELAAGYRRMGPQVWASAEYLMWFVNTQKLPPLVRGINGVQPGDTGYEDFQVVNLIPSGNGSADYIGGVRGTLGFWFNDAQTFGFEANYFWMGPQRSRDTFRSSQDMILGRPFNFASTGENSLFQVSSIDGTDGVIRVWQRFHADGGEANFLSNPFGIAPRLKMIAGFRFLQTSEGLAVGYRATDDALGFSAEGLDSYETRNRFYGGQVGLRWDYEGRKLFASLTGKIAYGSMEERVHIYGGTRVDNSGTVTEASGGVLAQPSNIGSYHRSRMAYIPEATAQIGYKFAPWASGFIGYNFMYISNLARPGAQVDQGVDPDNFPFGTGGGSRPGFVFKDESLWLQGINLGFSIRY